METLSINPFNYGRPVDDPARFIGRQREIEQIYSRLLSAAESTAVIGERRTGKTSLLKILAQPETLARFGADPEQYIFVFQDFQFVDESTTPSRFWQRVLRSIGRALKKHAGIVQEIETASQTGPIDNYTLDDIFTLIDEQGVNIVLLLDEFEKITRNRHFDSDFFGGMRALAIHHSLSLITSSRQDLVDLTHSETLRSSPFFNIFATLNLRSFSETEATELIDRYLTPGKTRFLPGELNLVFAVAGYHPYFLQMVCHHLFAAHQRNLDEAGRRTYLMEQLRPEAGTLFQDYWHSSSPSEQIFLTVMALTELDNRSGKGGRAEMPAEAALESGEQRLADLEQYYGRASQVAADLERRGLVIQNPTNQAYHLFSTELAEWIADEIVGSVDDLRSWRDWQKEETLIGLLPPTLQNRLGEVARKLNPAYQTTLGNWLLEPTTAGAALKLLETFIGHYEHYKSTRSLRAETMANPETPVGDTPKGLFAMISQRLESPQAPAADGPGLGKAIDSLDRQYRDEQIYSLKRRLLDQTRNLNRLREESATYGNQGSAPLKLQNDLVTLETIVAGLQQELAELEGRA